MEPSNAAKLQDKARQNAHRYGLATVDMQEVIEYLDCYDQLGLLHDADDDSKWAIACRGLLNAAVVAYCRPFGDNASRGYATQRIAITQLGASRARRALHELLMEKRNTFIAHAGWPARSTQITAVGQTSVTWHFPLPDVWQGLDVREFRRLVEDVLQECMEKGLEQAQVAHQVHATNGVA